MVGNYLDFSEILELKLSVYIICFHPKLQLIYIYIIDVIINKITP